MRYEHGTMGRSSWLVDHEAQVVGDLLKNLSGSAPPTYTFAYVLTSERAAAFVHIRMTLHFRLFYTYNTSSTEQTVQLRFLFVWDLGVADSRTVGRRQDHRLDYRRNKHANIKNRYIIVKFTTRTRIVICIANCKMNTIVIERMSVEIFSENPLCLFVSENYKI
jgi:hypothetical protein